MSRELHLTAAAAGTITLQYHRLLLLLLSCLFTQAATAAAAKPTIPYSEHILAPAQRYLTPVSVYQVKGHVSNPSGVTSSGNGSAVFFSSAVNDSNTAVTYDYGKNIGGIVSFIVDDVQVASDNNTQQYIGLAFSESSLWISTNRSDATQHIGFDELLWFEITGPGLYTVDKKHDRGGFRYLSLVHNTTLSTAAGGDAVSISKVSTYFTAMPHFPDDGLRDYTGYFHSNDEKLNRVWYAAAYTNQLCTIPSTNGLATVDLSATNPSQLNQWWANSTLTNGTSALVDGARRDKLIWPGDYSISLPAVFLTTNDHSTLKLSLENIFSNFNHTTNQLPYASRPLLVSPSPSPFIEALDYIGWSFTYHLHSIIGLSNYYTYTGDAVFVQQNWGIVIAALNHSMSYIDETGLANISVGNPDWLRQGMGGHNIEANAILAYTLDLATSVASSLSLSSSSSEPQEDKNAVTDLWKNASSTIKASANALLWDPSANMYLDNETTTLHPQDGNVWSILSGIADASRASAISASLCSRWGPFGAPAPEALPGTVSPFVSGLELQAHIRAGRPQSAVDLVRRMWADFMLDDARMTGSSFVEGFDADGSLRYPAYTDDAAVSHAHGWSTGPVAALTQGILGLKVLDGSLTGARWRVYPTVGGTDLWDVEGGFEIEMGRFKARYVKSSGVGDEGAVFTFETPVGTKGDLIMDRPECRARIEVSGEGKGQFRWVEDMEAWEGSRAAENSTVVIDNLAGGEYVVDITCL